MFPLCGFPYLIWPTTNGASNDRKKTILFIAIRTAYKKTWIAKLWTKIQFQKFQTKKKVAIKVKHTNETFKL